MMNLKIFGAFIISALLVAPVYADTFTASVNSLSPGTSVTAKTKFSFTVKVTGFVPSNYKLVDSFSGTTASVQNFDGGGNFSWVPVVSDVGVHTFTITANDYQGNSAQVTQTITVLPPPSVSIQSVAPGNKIPVGGKFTFAVSSNGFTNPIFIVGDDFGGSSVGNINLINGQFSWTPDLQQTGQHRINIYASDASGHSATANVDVQVGSGPQLTVQLMSTSTQVMPGQYVSFVVIPTQFQPTGYSLLDTFSGVSTISNGNINSNGQFYWTPGGGDVGIHKLLLRGQVGAFGDVATTSYRLTVLGQGGQVLGASSSQTAAAATTAGDSLDSLQAQLASLMTQIHQQTGVSTTPSTTGNTLEEIFTAYLKPGVQNNQVMELQKLLIQLGFLNGDATGYYGNATVDAVVKFQASKGLAQLGVVGPATREALNSILAAGNSTVSSAPAQSGSSSDGYVFEHFMGYGDDDADVTELQLRLKGLGFLKVEPTGFYGKATEAAVKKFQASKGLPAVGYCDKATRAALNH